MQAWPQKESKRKESSQHARSHEEWILIFLNQEAGRPAFWLKKLVTWCFWVIWCFWVPGVFGLFFGFGVAAGKAWWCC